MGICHKEQGDLVLVSSEALEHCRSVLLYQR